MITCEIKMNKNIFYYSEFFKPLSNIVTYEYLHRLMIEKSKNIQTSPHQDNWILDNLATKLQSNFPLEVKEIILNYYPENSIMQQYHNEKNTTEQTYIIHCIFGKIGKIRFKDSKDNKIIPLIYKINNYDLVMTDDYIKYKIETIDTPLIDIVMICKKNLVPNSRKLEILEKIINNEDVLMTSQERREMYQFTDRLGLYPEIII
jgi:hypothetical protein